MQLLYYYSYINSSVAGSDGGRSERGERVDSRSVQASRSREYRQRIYDSDKGQM